MIGSPAAEDFCCTGVGQNKIRAERGRVKEMLGYEKKIACFRDYGASGPTRGQGQGVGAIQMGGAREYGG